MSRILITVFFIFVAPIVSYADNLVTARISTFSLNLHPHQLTNADSRLVASALHAGLIAKAFNGHIEPRLASSWDKVNETTVQFNLRSDVVFSNGEEVTSDDVIASLCGSLQPSSPYSWALAMIDHEQDAAGKVVCSGLEAVDKQHVRITTTSTGALHYLMEALASPPAWIIPRAAQAGEYGLVPGLGPFRLARVEPDHQVVLEPRAGGVVGASLGMLTFRYMPDNAVASTALKSGTLDFLEVDSPQLGTLLGLRGEETNRLDMQHGTAKVERFPIHQVRLLVVNEDRLIAHQKEGQSDLDSLVDAISQAIDRSEIANVSGGYTRPLPRKFVSAIGKSDTSPFPSALLDKQTTNIDLAGARLKLIYQAESLNDLLVETFPNTLIGATVEPTPMEIGVFTKRLVNRDYDLALLTLEAVMDSPHYWMSFFNPDSPFVVFGKSIPALSTLDPFRKSDQVSAERLIAARGNWIPLVQDVHALVIGPDVEGIRVTSTGRLSLETIRPSSQ